MYKFSNMFVCAFGDGSDELIMKTKKIIEERYPVLVGKSNVHWERSLLANNSETRVLLFNKNTQQIE